MFSLSIGMKKYKVYLRRNKAGLRFIYIFVTGRNEHKISM